MSKCLPLFVLTLFSSVVAFAQQPPLLNSFTYTHTPGILTTCINYTPNDTGIVLVQFQLSKGELGDVYIDQYFQTSADTNAGCFTIYGIYACVKHYVTLNLSNSHAYGPVANPLFIFNSSCAVGVDDAADGNYSLLFYGGAITVNAKDVQPNTAIEIYDMQGRLIQTEKITSTQHILHLAPMSAGIYVVRVTQNGWPQLTERVVIR